MSDLLNIAAATLPVWRDSVIAVLAFIVIGCLFIAAQVFDA